MNISDNVLAASVLNRFVFLRVCASFLHGERVHAQFVSNHYIHVLTDVVTDVLRQRSCLDVSSVKEAKIAVAPEGIGLRSFLGAACLCGVGDTVSLLMADQAFPQGAIATVAKIGVLIGSVLAAALGASILAFRIASGDTTEAGPAPS